MSLDIAPCPLVAEPPGLGAIGLTGGCGVTGSGLQAALQPRLVGLRGKWLVYAAGGAAAPAPGEEPRRCVALTLEHILLAAGCAGSLFSQVLPKCFPTPPRQLSTVLLGHAPGLVGPLCSSCASLTRQCADQAPRYLVGGMAACDGA